VKVVVRDNEQIVYEVCFFYLGTVKGFCFSLIFKKEKTQRT